MTSSNLPYLAKYRVRTNNPKLNEQILITDIPSISTPDDDVSSKITQLLFLKVVLVKSHINRYDDEIARIQALKKASEVEERELAFAPSQLILRQAQIGLARLKSSKTLAIVRSPFRYWQLRKAARGAQKAHDAVIKTFDSPTQAYERTQRITAHNQAVQDEQLRLATISAERCDSNMKLSILNQLESRLKAPCEAAKSTGWRDAKFSADLASILKHIKNEDFALASTYAIDLQFQQKPNERGYENLKAEAAELFNKSNSSSSGFLATAAYSRISSNALQLAKRALQPGRLKPIFENEHPADQWIELAASLTDPRSMRVDALWAIYWAMFIFSEQLSDSLRDAHQNENVINGRASEKLGNLMATWSGPRIEKFGYPKNPSFIGTLEIAQSGEETRTGADLGVIIDLHVGALTCKKVALFQAKKAINGKSIDVGSEHAQLKKLLATPQLGHYLFYHLSKFPQRPQWPTVCTADDLMSQVNGASRYADDSYLPVNVRELGWDWTNYMTFGLCQPDSGIGVKFVDIDHALQILGGGSSDQLPRHLLLVAISDEEHVLEIRNKITQRYHERTREREPERKPSHSKPQGYGRG
ncbi:hypothetical protein [Undibacterium sp. GrIS 1.2]|uniref:hypothetical protein n=1 Tax=Undibacterium sp. GrIS 1.2 TaxID=3143933 RepID=UPI00339462E3